MANIDCERLAEHSATAKRAKEGILSGTDLARVCRIFQLLSFIDIKLSAGFFLFLCNFFFKNSCLVA